MKPHPHTYLLTYLLTVDWTRQDTMSPNVQQPSLDIGQWSADVSSHPVTLNGVEWP